MNIMEIILLTVGIIAFIVSFLIPDGKKGLTDRDREAASDEIRDLLTQELEKIHGQVDETVEEAIQYSMEKTERSLERISNEKIMAVSEYSETVLEQMNKSQQEIMFLYDMLNAKHDSLTNIVTKVEKKIREAEIAGREIEAVTREAETAAQMARQAVAPALQTLPTEAADNEEEAVSLPPKQDNEEDGMAGDQPEQPEAGSCGNKNEEILRLHRQGRSNVSIARQLGLGVGEVKLVIGLFKGSNHR